MQQSKSPETDGHIYRQVTFAKGHWKWQFLKKLMLKYWLPICRKMNFDPHFVLYKKINLK
jgi:hypothetical protein